MLAEHIIIILIVVVGTLWYGHSKRPKGLVFPKPRDSDVVYYEEFASGFFGRRQGAVSCLRVMVTKSHLATTTFFPFTIVIGVYDLEHLIPFSDITRLEMNGPMLAVWFIGRDGSHCKLSLFLSDSKRFLNAMPELERNWTDSEQ